MDVEESRPQGPKKHNNVLPLWGNEKTMNLNSMILTNVLSSPYFKNELFQLKTYHEVVDEIYYKVDHLEPWEKGSRKTAGQVGMCGGVRGVGAGGIVSTAYCLLYKLFTLRLTRKQLNGLITHVDSPYIRALGFMFIRYCQPPNKLWEWMELYLEDEEAAHDSCFHADYRPSDIVLHRAALQEEVDPKAGGGCTMTIGQMVRSFLLKLEWYGTLFPRIPVPVQKDLEAKLRSKGLCDDHKRTAQEGWGEAEDFVKRTREDSPSSRRHGEAADGDRHPKSRRSRSRSRDRDRGREKRRSRSRDGDSSRRRSRERRSHERRRDDSRDRDRRRKRSRSRGPNRRSRDEDRKRRSRSRDRNRERRRSSDRDESRGRSNRDKKGSREKDRSRSR